MKPSPVKPTIASDLVDKIDVRVGTIEKVENIEKSRSLVKLTVDFGDHRRTILVAMKQERAKYPRDSRQAGSLRCEPGAEKNDR